LSNSIAMLTEGLKIEIGRQDRAAETRVGTILAKEGATKKRRRIDGRLTWISVLAVSPEPEGPPPHERTGGFCEPDFAITGCTYEPLQIFCRAAWPAIDRKIEDGEAGFD
jgi:hypothetical protein